MHCYQRDCTWACNIRSSQAKRCRNAVQSAVCASSRTHLAKLRCDQRLGICTKTVNPLQPQYSVTKHESDASLLWLYCQRKLCPMHKTTRLKTPLTSLNACFVISQIKGVTRGHVVDTCCSVTRATVLYTYGNY